MLNFLGKTDFEETPTVGGFGYASKKNSFDSFFESASDQMKTESYDFKTNINDIIKNPDMVEEFKSQLLGGIMEECAERASLAETDPEHHDCGSLGSLAEECSMLFDNTVDDLYQESTRVGQLLPIKAIDLPLVVKSHIAAVSKSIISTKVTKSPIIKKQIERTYVVDPETKKRYQYPQCLFNGEYAEIYKAGKGLPIKNDPQTLPLFDFDVIEKLTTATVPEREDFTLNLQIVQIVIDDGTTVTLKKPITIDAAQCVWVGGVINGLQVKNATGTLVTINDVISGSIDFVNKTVTVTSASGMVKKVVFGGNISNEKNERDVTFDYGREDNEWKIDDGFRVDVSYSIEELQDAKALLDMDLYKKTYNNLTDLLFQMEDNKTLDFLDDKYNEYQHLDLDPLDFNPFVSHTEFDVGLTQATVALQSEYIATMLKFKIDRFLLAIADKAKLEGITFVIYGNPQYISLLAPNVNWVVKNGDMLGGVKLNYSYGIMTSGDIKVQVVSCMKLDVKKYNNLRVVAFPTSEDTITFEHYKYATHIATSQNSAYRSAKLPGGSQTYLMGTSRYTNICLQGIQGDVGFVNAASIGIPQP